MERFDVAIVGGGPAGSSLAWGLRDSGLRVGIVDRAKFPRDKTCAGWVTPSVWRSLAVDLGEYAAGGRTLQPIRGFAVGVEGGGSARVAGAEVVSHGIRRCELDAFLLARSGAALRLGERVREIARVEDGWLLDGRLHARLLVGAGGHFCPVARAIGGADDEGAAITAQEIEAPISQGEEDGLHLAEEIPHLSFTRDLAGYGWVFRKGRFLNVGIGRRGGGVAAALRTFVAEQRAQRRVPAGWSGEARGHAYLTYRSATRPLWRAGVALIGDAAGLAHDRSGEGIRPAVESGLLLARALLASRALGDAAALEAYAAAVTARYGPRAEVAGAARVPRWRAAAARALLVQPWFARRVVVEGWFLSEGRGERL